LGRYLKLAISCAFCAVNGPFVWASKYLGVPRRASLVILYYHSVSAANKAGFARQMDTLERRAQVVHADWRGKSGRRRLCAITFDDAFISVIENAVPELARRDLPCTIFVPLGNLGRPPEWAMEVNVGSGEVVAEGNVIKSLSSPLVKLGSHSISHPYLSRIPCEVALQEIEQSRSMLRSITGEEVRLISFPYGDHNAEIEAMCQQAGYDFAFGIHPVPIDPANDRFVRGRVSVDPDDSRLEFLLKMSGCYRWIPAASALKRALKARLHIWKVARYPRVTPIEQATDGNIASYRTR
jgi:peptidoglycan/xylan/chitin deacetylase (PgdA/CDA1 family)